MTARKILARLLKKCRRERDCLVWVGAANDAGQPLLNIQGRMHDPRRWLLEHCGIEVPEGMVARNTCSDGHRACLNADHIELRPDARRKLSAAQVAEIRRNEASLTRLARKFGVSRQAINDVRQGRNWA